MSLCNFNFSSQDVSGTVTGYEIPPPENVLKLPVVRKAGKFGSMQLHWEAIPATASLDDFMPSFGNLTFADGQVSRHFVDMHGIYVFKFFFLLLDPIGVLVEGVRGSNPNFVFFMLAFYC